MRAPRRLLLASCLAATAAFVAACSGGDSNPLAPSESTRVTGAVVAGTVASGGSVTASDGGAVSGDVPPGLTVAIMGTSRSTSVDGSGYFEIQDVPAGTVQLQFTNATVNATTTLSNVTNDQFVQLQVMVNGSTAQVVSDQRLAKVTLCHAEGNGDYHFIDISQSAEQAHRDHGDGKVGDPVPGQPFKTFDANCNPVGPEVTIEKSTNGSDSDDAPGEEIPVGTPLTWEYVVTNTGNAALTGVAVTDDQGVTVTCPATTLAVNASMTCTGTGLVTAVGPYANVGLVTANFSVDVGSGSVTDSDASHYLGVSSIEIEKLTNGEDADTPTGPQVNIGDPIVWEYQLTNIGVVDLTGVVVVDDQGETVDCGGQTTLAAGASMTCTANGVAEAGQYANVGTVTANWASGTFSGQVTDSDPSHYLGVDPDEVEGPKVDLCHRTGAGFYVLINVSVNAEPAHRAHGDAEPGEAVPGQPGRTFTSTCGVG